jgi:beta-N-acetylhexosaminidase
MDARETPVERRTETRAQFSLPSDLRRRIGQMVMVGFRGMTPAQAQPIIRQIDRGLVGAVVLYDVDSETGGPKNIQSRDQLRELNAALKGAGQIPVLSCIDAEGGFYHRLKEKHGFAPAIPAA